MKVGSYITLLITMLQGIQRGLQPSLQVLLPEQAALCPLPHQPPDQTSPGVPPSHHRHHHHHCHLVLPSDRHHRHLLIACSPNRSIPRGHSLVLGPRTCSTYILTHHSTLPKDTTANYHSTCTFTRAHTRLPEHITIAYHIR